MRNYLLIALVAVTTTGYSFALSTGDQATIDQNRMTMQENRQDFQDSKKNLGYFVSGSNLSGARNTIKNYRTQILDLRATYQEKIKNDWKNGIALHEEFMGKLKTLFVQRNTAFEQFVKPVRLQEFRSQNNDQISMLTENADLREENMQIRIDARIERQRERAVVLSKIDDQNPQQTVTPGTLDVVLWNANIDVKESVKLGDLSFVFTGLNTGNLSGYFTSFKLKVGNAIVATTAPTQNGKNIFNSMFSLTGGANIQILGVVKATVSATAKFVIAPINASSFGVKEFASDGKIVEGFKGAVRGIPTTIQSSIRTIPKFSIPKNNVIDATNAYRFIISPVANLENGVASRIVLKKITILVSQTPNPTDGLRLFRSNVAIANAMIAQSPKCTAAGSVWTCVFTVSENVEVSTPEDFLIQSMIPATAGETRSVKIVGVEFGDWYADRVVIVSDTSSLNLGLPTPASMFRF